jgi:magnesium-transporting ATPase (P-type)
LTTFKRQRPPQSSNPKPTLTISQFLLHLLISNIAQVVLLLIGLAFQDRNGVSAFPLSPLEILFANLITSSFLAIGLGLESASSDVMIRPPHSLRAGVFTKELIIDKFIYGTCMGTLCLVSFVIVVYAHGDGDLGADCNHSYNDTCSLPFRARATAYSILTVLLSNRVVFRHAPLSWEWGLVFGSVVIFVALVESWKAVKRRSLKKRAVARQLAGGSGSGSVEGDDKSSIA